MLLFATRIAIRMPAVLRQLARREGLSNKCMSSHAWLQDSAYVYGTCVTTESAKDYVTDMVMML